MAKILSTEDVEPTLLTEFISCKLIPLDKGEDKQGNIGVRPVGVGEVLRRIIGKVVVRAITDEVQEAVGPLQTCTGLKSGIEATVHATKRVWDDPNTEAVLLVDADNAFNRINRRLGVHNIREICPPFHRYLSNTYQSAAKLIVNDGVTTEVLYSDEGCTQGDVAAMAFYALSVKPLTDELREAVDTTKCKQAWYADDANAFGKINEIKLWWDYLSKNGPKYGYFPKPSKTVLIIKNQSLQTLAETVFAETGVQITSEGERHLGAVVGTEEFKVKYVSEKVSKWKSDVAELSNIALDDPQAALSAFTKAMCHRWTFVQRTVDNTSELFIPLEETIREKFIPAIVGRKVSDIERKMISLPVRHGGLGIINPVLSADRELSVSKMVTAELTDLIINQENTLEKYNKQRVKETVKHLKMIKEQGLKQEASDVAGELND